MKDVRAAIGPLTEDDVREITVFFTQTVERWADRSRGKSKKYNGVTEAFRANPTIAQYLAIRTAQPDESVNVEASFAWDEWAISSENELLRFGIDPLTLIGALDGNRNEVSKVCLVLMNALVEKDRLKLANSAVVARKLAIPDSLVDFIVWLLLEATTYRDMWLHPDLLILAKERLVGSKPDHIESFQISAKRKRAVQAAAHVVMDGDVPTWRTIAKKLNVAHTTVRRWFEGDEFTDYFKSHVSMWRRHNEREAERESTGASN